MTGEGNIQMYLRILRRQRQYILFILILVSLMVFWVNFHLSKSLSEKAHNCHFPCLGTTCVSCVEEETEIKIPSLNIFEKLKLKQAFRVGSLPKVKSDESDQICKRPNFDSKHDSIKYAFHSVGKLNCTGESLFKIDNGVFKLDNKVLKGRELEKCDFYGIERISDDYSTYSEAYTKKTEAFDLVIKQDFVRIKCFLKNEKEEKSEKGNKERKLLSVSLRYFKNLHNITKNVSYISELHKLSNASLRSSNLSVNTKFLDKEQIFDQRRIEHGRDVNVEGTGRKSESKSVKFVRGLKEKNETVQFEDELGDDKDKDNELSNEEMYVDLKKMREYYENYDNDENFEETSDFDQFLVHVYPRHDVHDRILKQLKELIPEKSNLAYPSMNVLIFGLDSMSHMAYQRKLPKTYRYLQDDLGAVILDGYNIVGDATTAALLPMLTGKPEVELPEARKKQILSEYCNKFPLIWNDFRDHRYVTIFAEDEPSISTFNLRLNGFDAQPTDHYMRPFWTSLWESDLRSSSPRFCTGYVPNHMFLLNYTRSFFDAYKNVSKFAFVFGSELTHWNNNPGEYMDDDFVEFLKYLQGSGNLKNTLLIVMADHGARYSAVRKTVQGKLEERLPMMSLTFPDWFKQKYPHLYKNLINNSDRLATPFDIYETLKHVLHIVTSTKIDRILDKHKVQRGISLLHPIPHNRTCAMADVQMHWCTCLKQVEIHSGDVHVRKSVGALLRQINDETAFVRDQCVELSLKRVHSAYLLIPNEQVLMFQKTQDEDNRVANFSSSINIDHAHFQITMETFPNHGLFEATVQVNMTAGSYLVMDGISRLDMYGNQPACVQEKYPDLRKYCFCKNTVH